MATISDEIDNRPAILPPLKMIKAEVGEFTSAKTATEQDRNDRSVALALEAFGIGGLPQGPSFLGGQPISQPNAKLLEAFYPTDASRKFWAE